MGSQVECILAPPTLFPRSPNDSLLILSSTTELLTDADPLWPDRRLLGREKREAELVKSSPELLILSWSCFALNVTSFYISGILPEALLKDGYYSMDYCPGMHLWGLHT